MGIIWVSMIWVHIIGLLEFLKLQGPNRINRTYGNSGLQQIHPIPINLRTVQPARKHPLTQQSYAFLIGILSPRNKKKWVNSDLLCLNSSAELLNSCISAMEPCKRASDHRLHNAGETSTKLAKRKSGHPFVFLWERDEHI